MQLVAQTVKCKPRYTSLGMVLALEYREGEEESL